MGTPTEITLGIDTHLDVHAAVALDSQGRVIGTLTTATTSQGHRDLVSWAAALGTVTRAGIEGTGAFGAGLSRHLRACGIQVVEVDRPDRRRRRTLGKTDLVDAEIAARAVLSGALNGQPKSGDGHVECLRMLRVARRSGMKARTQTANQLHALVVTAPEALREQLRELSLARLVSAACRWRVTSASDPTATARFALRTLARRYRFLAAEISDLDREIMALVGTAAPALLALQNVGPDTAAALLIAAGDNAERLDSEASFAHLCGVAPLQASSGKSHRHRLNRGGNREANAALYTIVLGRLYRDDRTRAYMDRRTAEGLSKREIVRCLKRFVAREVFRTLPSLAPRGSCVIGAAPAGCDVDLAA